MAELGWDMHINAVASGLPEVISQFRPVNALSLRIRIEHLHTQCMGKVKHARHAVYVAILGNILCLMTCMFPMPRFSEGFITSPST